MNKKLAPAYLLVIWLVSRFHMAWLWRYRIGFVDADVRYYFAKIQDPNADLIEYPPPISWLLEGLSSISGSHPDLFMFSFVIVIFLLDVLANFLLWRFSGVLSALYWTVFVYACGPLLWFRIDMIPALAVLLSLVLVGSKKPKNFWSGGAIAIGAATKLWPAMLVAPLLGRTKTANQRFLGFLIVGGGLGLTSLLVSGWDRSISALTWQSDRGLQIESLPASYLMGKRAFGSADILWVELSNYNAWEIKGLGTEIWLAVSNIALVVTMILTAVLAALLISRNHKLENTKWLLVCLTLSMVAITLAVICANKTFSPQYIIWLAGPLAILANLEVDHLKVGANWLAILGLLAALLTQLVYPLNYQGLLNPNPDLFSTLILLIRNTIVASMTVIAWILAFKATLTTRLRSRSL